MAQGASKRMDYEMALLNLIVLISFCQARGKGKYWKEREVSNEKLGANLSYSTPMLP